MSNTFNKSMTVTALNLIKIFGVPCTLNSSGKNYSSLIAFIQNLKTDSNETYVVSNVKTAYLTALKVIPLPGDTVTVGSNVLVVTTSETISPDGITNVAFKLTLEA